MQGRIAAENLPVSGALREFADRDDAYRLALVGGDDYELCFTVSPDNEHRLKSLPGEPELARIGELYPGEGLVLTRGGKTWAPTDSGFRHF